MEEQPSNMEKEETGTNAKNGAHCEPPIKEGVADSQSVQGQESKSAAISPELKGSRGSGETPVTRKPGYAPIKAEFLLLDYKPKLQTKYLSAQVKEQLDLDNKKKDEQGPDKDESSGKRSASELAPEGQPPNKVAKLKGRNKQRPGNDRVKQKDRLCPAIKDERECSFGDKCKFNHSKEDFMANKLPDLEGPCYNFENFGFCKYSLACRFAKNHTTEDLQNVVDEELLEKTKSEKHLNVLESDVRQKLWKKKYDFSKADQMVKKVQRDFRGQEEGSGKSNFGKDDMKTVGPKSGPTGDLCASTDKKSISNTCDNRNPGDCSGAEVVSVKEQNAESPDSSKLESNRLESQKPASVTTTASECEKRTVGHITDEELFPLNSREKVKIDLKNKLYLAPLTTVGNLPFRRICKGLGAEVTCGEMALATQLLQAKQSEWSLLKRHPCEDIFGMQICGGYPDTMTRCAQLLTETCDLDFIDINCGCPIELIFKKGSGSALMGKATKLEQICRSMMGVMGNTPLTVKLRTGVFDNKNIAHNIIPRLRDAGVSLVTVHGRSREQRYTRQADWDYITQCATAGAPMPVFGNGDVLSFEDANLHMETHGVSGIMIARGALIKPWIFTEIKEQRHWDISSSERFDLLKTYTNYGMEHWGSDHQGVENTRRFLLEWLSFLHRV
ncbi:tRNA-dihydrouridine(47) synthase [NAD(P)(+)]-like isoform X2 [Aplysia californica]|uniref:tRNA-dihydrouridine(47) synthase [NAD(P)(+)] n=1 Tax=Aplysia californica TaxID=6500 RepID=A0ABM0JAY1_APLCA|nr:tRNA-dihydrouridine(47) synthase [NAD(P)(+)]-like isoform X2 [Aplysia californica]